MRYKQIHLAVSSLVSLLIVSGCSGGEAPGGSVTGIECPSDVLRQNVVVVVGVHANMPRPTLTAAAGTPTSPELTCALDHLLIEGGDLTVIGVDGQPEASTERLAPMSTKASPQNERGWERVLRDERSKLEQLLAVSAEHEGADLYRALELALRSASIDPEGSAVFVLDNGLTDRGVVDLTQTQWFDTDASLAVETLAESGPPLQESPGATVVLSGMAATALPQEPLSIEQERMVSAIWTELLQRAGATVKVKPAAWATNASNPTELKTGLVMPEEEGVSPPPPPPPVPLDPDALGFTPDDAVPDLSEDAVGALRRFVQFQEEEEDARLYVIGRTDSTPTTRWASNERLSQARADAVRDVLVELGADRRQIVSSGQGYVGCPPDGGQARADTQKQAKNRIVIVGVFETDDAKPPTGCFLDGHQR